MMNYYVKGKPVRRANALAHVIVGFQTYHLNGAGDYFEHAHDQSTEGYIARQIVEDHSDVTMRHASEEQRP